MEEQCSESIGSWKAGLREIHQRTEVGSRGHPTDQSAGVEVYCLDGEGRAHRKVASTAYKVFWILQVIEAIRIKVRPTTAEAQTLLLTCANLCAFQTQFL